MAKKKTRKKVIHPICSRGHGENHKTWIARLEHGACCPGPEGNRVMYREALKGAKS